MIALNKDTQVRQTIVTCDQDREYIKRFEHELWMLTGMVVEMVEEHPSYLLSPIMRESLARKAKEVAAMRDQLLNKLCADNLNEPFK